MKKILVILLLSCSLQSQAQLPIIDIIRAGIKKVIVAIDLKIQQLQNKTIWLQNVQKVVENKLSQVKLTEISDWVQQQKQLYAGYFEELKQVRQAIRYYHKVKELIRNQAALVQEYKDSWAVFRRDQHFNAEELRFMESVYDGMLKESLKQLDQLLLVLSQFQTQMTDAKRLELIDAAALKMEETFFDLKAFNHQNKTMSLQRAHERGEIEYSRRLYGF